MRMHIIKKVTLGVILDALENHNAIIFCADLNFALHQFDKREVDGEMYVLQIQ